MKPKPLQPTELFGVAIICAAAVGLSAFLPGQTHFLVTAGAWMIGTILVTSGGLALTRRDSQFSWMGGPVLAVVFAIGTALFLSSTLQVPALLLIIAHASIMGFVLIQEFQKRERSSTPARAAIRVRTEAPHPVPQRTASPQKPPLEEEPIDSVVAHEIDTGFEQALLSRLSVDSETDLASDEELRPEAIRFQEADSNVFQRIERGQDANGGEWLEGTIRVDFLRNQKTSIVHIPFWPAFQVRPEVNSELLEGPQLTIEAKTVERWGIRLELTRRAAGLDPEFAELAFFVSTHSAAREAA